MNNRWRQEQLAMEERFVVHSYPQRLFTTVFGVMAVDAYNAARARTQTPLTYKEWIKEAAVDGMHNTIDFDNAELRADRTVASKERPAKARPAQLVAGVLAGGGDAVAKVALLEEMLLEEML